MLLRAGEKHLGSNRAAPAVILLRFVAYEDRDEGEPQ
jgi:hypothetical protein